MLYGFFKQKNNLTQAAPLLVLLSLFLGFATAAPLYAVTGTPGPGPTITAKNCTYSYSSDKGKITSGDCDSASDTLQDETFVRSGISTYTLKKGSCTATIKIPDTKVPAKGNLSGKAAQYNGACTDIKSQAIGIEVNSSNTKVAVDAAAASLVDSSGDALTALYCSSANGNGTQQASTCESTTGQDYVNNAITKCSNNLFNGPLAASFVITGTDPTKSPGVLSARTSMINCLADAKIGSAADIGKIVSVDDMVSVITGVSDAKYDKIPAEAIDSTNDDSCKIDGIGWIVCPVVKFIAKLNDSAFSFLTKFLEIKPALITDKATKSAWSTFRDFANVAFIIAFMIIVYSQLTSAGVSNYGIKKLLPKVVIAAILVNVSYYICAAAVDLSNIVGSSIYQLFTSIPVKGSEADPGSGGLWESIVVGALTLGSFIILFGIVLVAPIAILAFALILLILIARQGLILLLVIVSPVAFVLYLLPNTESLFKKWWQALKASLMVFPIVGLVFGASTMASKILLAIAGDGGNAPQVGEDDNTMLAIVALGVMAIPLFAVPAILKGSLSAAGSIGNKLANLADRTQSNAARQGKAKLKDYRDDAKNRWNIAANDSNSRLGQSKLGAYSRWKSRQSMARHDRETASKRAADLRYATDMIATDSDGNLTARAMRMQQAAAGGVGAANEKAIVRAQALATQRTFKQFDEDVSAFQTTQTSKRHDELAAIQTDASKSVEERAAAAGTIASRSYRAGHNDSLAKMHEQMANADTEYLAREEAYNTAVKNNASSAEIKSAKESLEKATANVDAQSAIQKQFQSQWKEKSFGMGDGAMGELGEGRYGRNNMQYDENGAEKGRARQRNIYEDTLVRAETKLNEQGLVTMNPDDLTIILRGAQAEVGSGNELSDEQMKVVVEKIANARSNKETNKLIKKDASDKFDIIMERARSRGITPPTPTNGSSES